MRFSHAVKEVLNLHNILVRYVLPLMGVVADGLGICFVADGLKSIPLRVNICVSLKKIN